MTRLVAPPAVSSPVATGDKKRAVDFAGTGEGSATSWPKLVSEIATPKGSSFPSPENPALPQFISSIG